MRRREGVRLALAGLLAGAGVLVLPVGASSYDGPPALLAHATPTEPSPTEPSTTEPSTTEPSPTEPSPTEPSPTEPTPTEPSPTEEPDAVVVSDAVFAWSLSQQSNAASHEPGRYNFFSAGAANPGGGGRKLTADKWSAREGNVSITKQRRDGSYALATFAGLTTGASGETVGLYGPFSGHRVTVARGRGSVAPATDDATIQWAGTFTVVYYSGRTVFTLSNIELDIAGGDGVVRATAGGWAADRSDPDSWVEVTPREVTLADLRDVDVTPDGAVATPQYDGVTVTGSVRQERTGAHWGAFPQSLVSFLEPMGTDQFWYSTGLQSDWTKVADPIALGWGGKAPDDGDPPPTEKPTPEPTNPVTPAPEPTPAPDPPALPPSLAEVPDAAPVRVEEGGRTWSPPTQVAAVQPAADDAVSLASAHTNSTYVVGGALLLAAAGLLLAPLRSRRVPTPEAPTHHPKGTS